MVQKQNPKKDRGGLYAVPTPDGGVITAAVAVGLVLELLLLVLYRGYAATRTFRFVSVLVVILAVLCAIGAGYFLFCLLRSGSGASAKRLFLGMATALLLLAGSFVIMRLFWLSGTRYLFILWGGAALLVVLDQIYQREFVFLAGLTGLFAVGALASYRAMEYGRVQGATVLISLLLVAAALFTALLTALAGKSGGSFRLFGEDTLLYARPSSRILLYVTAAVVAVCAVAMLLLGRSFCYYCFFVALAWLLICAAIYTIRLM